MTIADIDKFMPNPINRKLCAIVAKHCANVAFGPYFCADFCASISFTSDIDNKIKNICNTTNTILLINKNYMHINLNHEQYIKLYNRQ